MIAGLKEPIIKDIDDEKFFSVVERGIVNGTFMHAAQNGFRKLQDFSEKNNILGKHIRVVGVSPDNPAQVDLEKARYICCMRFEDEVMVQLKETEEVKLYTIPKCQVAVFTHLGMHENIQKSYKWIVEEYLPKAPYKFRTGFSPFECYLDDPSNTKKEDLRTEIYIPILPRKEVEEFKE